MDFASLIIREGDRVTASGRVVRNETGDWFEPPVPVTANFSLACRVKAHDTPDTLSSGDA
jgi:hypothetical protein